ADVKNGSWWAASAHLPAGTFLRALTAHVSGKSNDDIAASLAGGQNPNAKTPPAVPASASRASAPTVTNTYSFGDINITQQPGQDGSALANQIMRELQKKQAVQSRSIMFDGASQ